MNKGDRVRLVGIPPDCIDDDQLQTRSLFEKCLGRDFVVREIRQPDGVPFPLASLDVGHVLGLPSYEHTIHVEEKYLTILEPHDTLD